MAGAPVSLVVGKAVFRELAMERRHYPVSGYLGKYGSGSNGEGSRVAIDYGGFGKGASGYPGAIHENAVGRDAKPLNGAAHGQICGLQDIDAVDFLSRRLANAMCDSDFDDPLVKT